MRKLSIFILLGAILTTIFSATRAQTESSDKESQLVDIKANLVYPHKINDTLSVLCLVGDFAAQHNGAVITADSAVRYEDDRLECFGNVLINKNTTYAYADVAEYDGANNTASLYAPIIKVIDEDITMYTYNFTFNTLTNVGQYWGNGLSTKAGEISESGEVGEESVMESSRGYYYADDKLVIGVKDVELKSEGYLLKGDSVIYDMTNDKALFYNNTNIWSLENNDYIYGDRGLYDKGQNLCSISKNGYILTKEQEVWCDSLDYFREKEMAILRSNIQIDDTTNKCLAFGDYAQYWGDLEKVLLTRRATLVSYDTQQSDSLFLSGDSILLLSYALNEGPAAERAANKNRDESALLAELLGERAPNPSEEQTEEEMEMLNEEVVDESEDEEHDDHDHHHHDHSHSHSHDHSIEESIVAKDTIPSERELKRIAKREAQKARNDARIKAIEAREYRKLVERRDKLIIRITEREAKGRNTFTDSLILRRISDEIRAIDIADSLRNVDPSATTNVNWADSLLTTETTEDEIERDSLYRVVKAFRNVRSYRNDMQMSCDSLIAFSFDTTMQLHIAPILWSGGNQINSDEMYFYTKEQNMDYADFVGSPIMVSQVLEGDTTHFNQVSGKEMTTFFTNNEVTRNEVNGNVQTIYYMQDEDTGEPTTVSQVESGSATFFIEERTLDGVIYRTSPTYVFAPLDRLPEDLNLYLPSFGWYPQKRPTRKTILEHSIRPSIREEKSHLEHPQFPIQSKISIERKRLTNSGKWEDRDDQVSESATAWMKSLGFTPGEPRKEGEDIF
ncbi:MAG: OstA-like protein [Rikenellaceae bacterium]